MFPSTHLCEQGFSAMFCMKTKISCPSVHDVSLSKNVSRIEALVLVSRIPGLLSYLHLGYSFVVNKMCITECSDECCFVCYKVMSLSWGRITLLSLTSNLNFSNAKNMRYDLIT